MHQRFFGQVEAWGVVARRRPCLRAVQCGVHGQRPRRAEPGHAQSGSARRPQPTGESGRLLGGLMGAVGSSWRGGHVSRSHLTPWAEGLSSSLLCLCVHILQVRRMMELVGHPVFALTRTAFGPVTLKVILHSALLSFKCARHLMRRRPQLNSPCFCRVNGLILPGLVSWRLARARRE